MVNQATVFGITSQNITVQNISDGVNNFGDNPTETPLRGCEIRVFNAVSPDQNGANDNFTVEGIEFYPDNEVIIFNRWGCTEYQSRGYDNTDTVFRWISQVRGTINDAEGLPTGTYYYIIRYTDFNGNTQTGSGYLYFTGR